MQAFAIAFSLALLLTAMFAFRFDYGRRPGVLAAYFLVFMSIEWIAGRYLIPPDAFGIEIAVLCLVLTVPFLVATYLTQYRGVSPESRNEGRGGA
jgi:hypothetical protein